MKRNEKIGYYQSMNIFVRVMILLVLFTSPVQVQAAEPLTITAVGDIMMGTDWPESLLPPENGQGIFNGVKEYLSGDIVLGNLE
ncbi:MAG: hypothetical protein GWN86_19090, partial [Desulfobacterales bacterium]|nr:hypothetical protein [Desulfobacterales bacterium]